MPIIIVMIRCTHIMNVILNIQPKFAEKNVTLTVRKLVHLKTMNVAITLQLKILTRVSLASHSHEAGASAGGGLRLRRNNLDLRLDAKLPYFPVSLTVSVFSSGQGLTRIRILVVSG
jgi:hypothetical protein